MIEKHPELSHWLEILAAALMAIAVVGSAFSAWQATRWGGQQSTLFAEASSARAQSTRFITTAGQQISYDAIVFGEFAIAFLGGALTGELPPEASRLRDLLVRDEFRPALDAWTALEPLTNPDAPRTPFEMEEYRNANLEEGERLSLLAESSLEEGKEANQNADDYILATVFFASVLFFGGIAPKFRAVYIRAVVLLLASAGLGFAIFMVVSLPRH